MVKHYQFSVLTDDEYSYHYICEQVNAHVKESGITSGIVTTVVAHTNCGIVVTEPLECIMDDFKVLLHKLVDDDAQYDHGFGRKKTHRPGQPLLQSGCFFAAAAGQDGPAGSMQTI